VWRDAPPPEAVRAALVPGVYALLSLCHASDAQQLLHSLDPAGRALLKTLRDGHAVDYAYQGKL
jgi:hypothetical protein